MKFELDDTLIDHIIFCMEDQHGDFYLDTKEKIVINRYYDILEEDDDYKRYISLPEWSANDGFRLMEKFANTLKNPVLRQELSNALNKKKGVFRAFKDTLSQYPQAEKLWLNIKDKRMKAEVIAWYNALREEWGLEPIGDEPEDIFGLVLEDFKIREEAYSNCGDICFIAETSEGQSAGCICANKTDSGLNICKLEVELEYRSMGLGKTLLSKLIEKAGDQSIAIDLPADADYFSRSLLLEGFKLASQRFIRK